MNNYLYSLCIADNILEVVCHLWKTIRWRKQNIK